MKQLKNGAGKQKWIRSYLIINIKLKFQPTKRVTVKVHSNSNAGQQTTDFSIIFNIRDERMLQDFQLNEDRAKHTS